MPSASDSNFIAVTRWRRCPYATTPPVWLDDDEWRTTPTLPADDDDLVDVQKYESAVAPLLEEGELDADAIVVTPSGNSSAAANHAVERRRREERWTDIGLEQLLQQHANVSSTNGNNRQTRNANTSTSSPAS